MKIISKINQEKVEAEFLKSEWYKSGYDQFREQYTNIVINPDFSVDKDNQLRKKLLWIYRSPLLNQLPRNIEWHIVEIDVSEFSRLLVIRENGWEKTFGNKKTLIDAARSMVSRQALDHGVDFEKVQNIKQSIGDHDFSEKLICISTDMNEPFTIIEGNHRALAFQLKKEETQEKQHIPKQIILGTSVNMTQAYWLNSL